jgi:SAM-dependent methyltransferase
MQLETLGPDAGLSCSILEQSSFEPASFDAVTLWDVLEHVPEPMDFMKLCATLLKPGGRLMVNVPDLDSPEARLLGKRWPLLLAEHLNYFTRRSLRICGEKAGLTLVRFGRRRVSFSLGYIMFRLSQHRIPGTAFARKVIGFSLEEGIDTCSPRRNVRCLVAMNSDSAYFRFRTSGAPFRLRAGLVSRFQRG